MLQDALAAKQHDLSSCVKRRESKLRQLFRLTTRYGGDYNGKDETIFLQANNIVDGHYFNLSTLPPFRLHVTRLSEPLPAEVQVKPLAEVQNVDSVPPNDHDTEEKDAAVPLGAGARSDGGDSVTQEPSTEQSRPSASEKAFELGKVLDQSLDEVVTERHDHDSNVALTASASSNDIHPKAGAPRVIPSQARVLSQDSATTLPHPSLEIAATEQTSTPAATIHLPTQKQQTQPLEIAEQEEREVNTETEDAGTLPCGEKDSSPHRDAGEPSTDEVLQPLPGNQTHDRLPDYQDESMPIYGNHQETPSVQPHVNSILRSEMDIVRADNAFAGVTPSTPDEQLRFEEAQALQHSKSKSVIPKGTEKGQGQDAIAAVSDGILGSLDDEKADEQATTDYGSPFSGVKARGSDSSIRHAESDRSFERPTPGLRENTFPGMTGGLSRDLTFSRRPPMRIDTGVPSVSESSRSIVSRKTTTPATGTPYTPLESVAASRSGPPTSQVQSPPERMTTRVSSGALRHKSVSEILGETPKHSSLHNDKAASERVGHAEDIVLHTPKSVGYTASPDAVAFRQRLNKLEEKDKSKLSTVVFVRQSSSSGYRHGESVINQDGDPGDKVSEPKDYLLPLFSAQAAAPSPGQQLRSLVLSAHKTLTTADHQTDFQEQQDCRILTRIYQLQSTNRWSLRQHERSVEPCRLKTHWDVLISQMRWLQTDFREERKWKLAAAKGLADACSQWVASSADERAFLQVKVRSISIPPDPAAHYMQTPELIPSREDDSSDITDFESPDFEASKRSAPARIFSLSPDIFIFGLHRTPVADKILGELPLYQPSAQTQDAALQAASDDSDDPWKSRVVPFSKFVDGKMISREPGPARKKSRFDHSDDQTHITGSPFDGPSHYVGSERGSEEGEVALFRHENKHIRDRIHAGHAFRPPSEYLMPSQSFFECRQSSQWTQGEDDKLRRLVREYAYNWSLVSSCLSTKSLFSSGAERRTPWECFERWVGLEGLPAEMSKTQYFKAYQSRLQAAQRNHEAQQNALQQSQGNNAAQIPARRRTTLPFLVDRRKNSKHLWLVDAMRKLAKKREGAANKQQQANLAAMRKQNEANQPRATIYTPQEFSRLKWEREQKQQEAARMYQQQMLLQREKASYRKSCAFALRLIIIQAKNSQRPGQLSGAPNMMPRGGLIYPSGVNASSPNVASAISNGPTQVTAMNHGRPMPAIPKMANGVTAISSVPSNSQGVPHAPMQPQMQIQQRMPPQIMVENARIYQEATRLQEQQRYLATQTQHQHPPSNGQAGASTSPNMGRVSAMSHHNSSLFGGIQGRSGSPSMNGGPAPTGSSASPRMTTPAQPQPLSNGTIPVITQIQNQVKARNPQASPEQINAMTTDRLSQQYRINQQAAMQAAAGNNVSAVSHNASIKGTSQSQQQMLMNGVNGRPPMNPQDYAQLMRSQQSNQQSMNAGGGGINVGRTVSRSATPQIHTRHAPSQSPRPSQVQMAGTQ